MKTRLILAALVAATTISARAAEPTDAQKAGATMSAMRSIATAVEAYSIDHHTYPAGTKIEDATAAVGTVYIRVMPEKDGWGTTFRYWSDGAKYRIVSCGSDAKCDESTWTEISKDPLPSYTEDAVFQNGTFLRFWAK
ncbi:MAG TPA: type II secretion system protein GspG [Thermoanaerobaculia bacterium]|jgi:type II secretory pathway pseudopilin PulG|nr:type II secretion system protein GspG [Thermoanaerobaculia bacterium]